MDEERRLVITLTKVPGSETYRIQSIEVEKGSFNYGELLQVFEAAKVYLLSQKYE